nr:glycerol-3-phosphate ABC transporter ATP-binding protein [Anaerolineae bacterium]
QRVAIGRSIVRNPKVFLFDEPLSNLDAKLRVQTRAEISKLWQRLGTTFIYVTHDQVEAMTMASRIAVMKDGILQQVDTPTQLYDHPNNVFVAGFIGSPSMNFFDATLVKRDGQLVVDTGVYQIPVPAAKVDMFDKHAGKKIILGLRPEDIHDADYQPFGITPAKIEASVEVVEQMGNEMIVYLEEKSKSFVARTDPRTKAHIGNRMGFVVNTDNMHMFDAESKLSLATLV